MKRCLPTLKATTTWYIGQVSIVQMGTAENRKRNLYKSIIICDIYCNIYLLFFTDAPTVILSFGSNLDPTQIAEGNDVYFECKISANPEVYKVVWLHNVSIALSLDPIIYFNHLFAY